MSWIRNIFPCWGSRKQRGPDPSAAQCGSKMDRDSDELTGFTGEMPPFEAKPKTKPSNYYVNGVEDQCTEKLTDMGSDSLFYQSTTVSVEVQATEGKPINTDCDSSDQVTVVESIDTVTPDHYEDLHFCGSTNAIPAEPSGKPTDHRSGSREVLLCSTRFLPLPPTPPTTPTPIETADSAQPGNLINCSDWEAFVAWAQAPSQL